MEIARDSLEALADKLDLSEDWVTLAMDLTSEFLRSCQEWENHNIDEIVKGCSFIATKWLNYEHSGKNISNGSQIAVTKFFIGSDPEQLDQLLIWLKQIIGYVTIDPEIHQSVKEFINSVGFISSFRDKYNRIWESLKFRTQHNSLKRSESAANDTLEYIKKMGWMIFILAKFNVLWNKIQTVDCAWMLMATFYVLITGLNTSETTWNVLEDCKKEGLNEMNTNKKVFDWIFKLMVKDNQYSSDDNTEPVRISISTLLKLLLKLKEAGKLGVIDKNSIKMDDEDAVMEDEEEKEPSHIDSIKGIFDRINLKNNYNKICEEYGKEIGNDQLDESFVNGTPFSKTPNP